MVNWGISLFFDVCSLKSELLPRFFRDIKHWKRTNNSQNSPVRKTIKNYGFSFHAEDLQVSELWVRQKRHPWWWHSMQMHIISLLSDSLLSLFNGAWEYLIKCTEFLDCQRRFSLKIIKFFIIYKKNYHLIFKVGNFYNKIMFKSLRN